MLGPGLGEVIARLVVQESNEQDKISLSGLSLYRGFDAQETLR
jgi:hypothetical protein